MSRRRWKGLLASAFVGAVAVVIYGCSSSGGGPVADSGTKPPATHRDSGSVAPVEAGTGSQRSDSGADSSASCFGSVSGSPVNSRWACSRSDLDASCAQRPLMTVSSMARARTIARVTVPMPAEFSVKRPCFKGLVFMRQFYVWC